MKKIEAIIRHDKFQAVFDALRQSGVGGMTTYEVSGFGNQRGRGKRAVKKIKLEVYADDFQADGVIDIIMKTARTGAAGETGDGKIAVSDLEKLYRIRTGEEGAKAI